MRAPTCRCDVRRIPRAFRRDLAEALLAMFSWIGIVGMVQQLVKLPSILILSFSATLNVLPNPVERFTVPGLPRCHARVAEAADGARSLPG